MRRKNQPAYTAAGAGEFALHGELIGCKQLAHQIGLRTSRTSQVA
jgi:hypothetical protein